MEYLTLRNGVKMPAIGFGAAGLRNGKLCEDILQNALACGYRKIDTAAAYEKE